jgi:hypothetical protein
MPVGERGISLQEVRAHLEELAATYMAAGADELAAQQRATQTFGDVRLLGRRLSAGHLTRWGAWRWAGGIVFGALLSWAIWTAGTLPAMASYFVVYPMTPAPPSPLPPPLAAALHVLILSTPLTNQAFYGYLALGWAWVLPLLLLYAVTPFLWGQRARNWWAPGLAFGLGTWLSMPWFILALPFFQFDTGDWAFAAEARIIFVALPLALLASFAGWLWRQWRGSRQAAPAQALA